MNLPRRLMGLALGQRLPRTSGTLHVDGLAAPVTIRRDGYGVPHIDAQTEMDAWYALGFCQGQDRAFQIEMLMRLTRGRVAELVGGQGLPLDRLSRRIGFRRSAEQQFEVLSETACTTLEAFARGVTDGATRGGEKLAHEFSLLRAEPSVYEPVDVLAMMKYLSLMLAPWGVKLARLLMLSNDGPEAVEAIANTYPDWMPVTRPVGARAGEAAARLGDDIARLMSVVSTWAASNNWALDSTRTATGRPLLANDPHLAPMIPVPWYLSHIRTPEWEAAGASLIGTPAIAVGHNEVAAWGVTAGLIDDVNLYLEEIGPDGRSVLDNGHYVPCRVRQEFIRVRGGAPIEEEVLVTPRGPIIGPALENMPNAISLSASWLAARPIEGFLSAHRAQSFEALREAFRGWSLGSFNIVYADTSDTLGWQLTGEAPQRDGAWSTVPLPGWDPTITDWSEEAVPYDRMPHLRDPEPGYLATANNKPAQEGDAPYLGDNWLDGYRCMRIVNELDQRRDWTVEDTQRLQLDQKSMPWQEMRDVVLAAPPRTEHARQALDLLREWDGVVAVDSAGATVYEFLLGEMVRRLMQVKAPNTTHSAMGRDFNPLLRGTWFDHRRISRLVQLINEQPGGWFVHSWPEEIADALDTVVRRLHKDYGPTPEHWHWGELRTVTLMHPLGEQTPFDLLFNLGPFPCGGDGDTVSQAKVWLANPANNPFAIPSLRMVVDVGNWDDNRFVLAGGQSGNPLSPHYDDQLKLWLNGEAMVMPWSEEQVQAATEATLRLEPGR